MIISSLRTRSESERAANPVQTTAAGGGVGETRVGSSPPFGTISILKGISDSRRNPFFHENGPIGRFVVLSADRSADSQEHLRVDSRRSFQINCRDVSGGKVRVSERILTRHR